MSDFDFDELDKAVSGVLSSDDVPSRANDAADTQEPARPTPVERSVDETPASRDAVVTPPAARRSSGRFMDVVHPSSDMRGKTSAFTPPTTQQPPAKPEVPAEQNDEVWAQPLESPFLPDAKVEKRPLGAFALDTPAADGKFEEELLLEAPDEPRIEAHAMPDPIDFAAQSSEEVVEEGVEQTPEIIEETPPAEVQEEVAEVPAPTPEPEVKAEPAYEETGVVGAASISQQYTEQPSSAPSSGAIYDTETYHQPLAPAPKKRSGVWIVIWILLLIVLGAGAGVAFYLYILPML